MHWLVCLLLLFTLEAQDASELARRAVEAHKRGDLASAVPYYEALLKGRPELTKVRVNLAAALAGLGRLRESVAVLEAAPGRERDNAELRRALALAYYQAQRYPEASGELEKLTNSLPGDVGEVKMLADCYLRTQRPDRAVKLLETAVKAHSSDAELKYQLGSSLVRAGNPDRALDPLEDAGRIGKNAEALLLAGATALDLGQFQRARKDLEEAIALNPSIPGAWTWTGMARDRVSDEEGAKDAFRKALTADPADFEAVFHLGAILYRERDLPAARPYIERAVALKPDSPLARYALALVRSASGELLKAVEDLEAVIAQTPDWVEPHVKLASLYFRLRRPTDGQREQKFVETLRAEHKDREMKMPAFDKQ